MTKLVCLDTSVIIDYLKGEGPAVNIVESYLKNERLATTTITKYELLKHTDVLKREIAEEMLSSMILYQFDSEAAVEAAKIYRELSAKGEMVNESDILILGIVKHNKEKLITRDTGFERLKGSNSILIF